MAFENPQGVADTAATAGNRGVAYIRPELYARFPDYNLIDDCVSGATAVKAGRTNYLPMPEPHDTSPKNVLRYSNYLGRAVFYNVTQRTAEGMLGEVFKREPIIEAPTQLDGVVTDSDGSGIGLVQLGRDTVFKVIKHGRAGLFVDYPPVEGVASRAQLQAGNVRPTIGVYGAKAVINWRTKVVGAKTVLTLVVLVENYTVEDDGFETKVGVQYRELRLDANGRYYVQLWRAPDVTGTDYQRYGVAYYPKDGRGNFLDAIPFTFIGSKDNEPSIDPPPMLDIANLNIGHFRNSADYEELVFLLGQPTLTITGLTQEWYKQILKEEIPFGSRNGLALPDGAKAELIQMQPNTVAKEAMEHKERQMASLGARLIQEKQTQRTAFEAGLENAAEESILVTIAKNVSSAMQWALEWCAVFLNVSEAAVKFELNTDFDLARLSLDDLAKVVKLWQSEATSFTEMRDALRKAGIASQTDDEARAEIEKDAAAAIERAAAEIGATTAAAGGLPGNVGSA